MALNGVKSSDPVTSLHHEDTAPVKTGEQKINSAFGDEVKEKTKIDGEISYDLKDPECPKLPKEKSGFKKFFDGLLQDMIYSIPLYGDYMNIKDIVNTMKGVGTKVEKITEEDGTKVKTYTVTDKNGNITGRLSKRTYTDGSVDLSSTQVVYDKSGKQLSEKTVFKYANGITSTQEVYTDDNGNRVTELADFSKDGTMTYLYTTVCDKDGNGIEITKNLNDDGTMSVEEVRSDADGHLISSVEKTIGKDGKVIDN